MKHFLKKVQYALSTCQTWKVSFDFFSKSTCTPMFTPVLLTVVSNDIKLIRSVKFHTLVPQKLLLPGLLPFHLEFWAHRVISYYDLLIQKQIDDQLCRSKLNLEPIFRPNELSTK